MNSNTRNGLIAAGLAAVAYWFKGMTPEQRANVKNKVTEAGRKFSEKLPQDLKNMANRQKTNVSDETAV